MFKGVATFTSKSSLQEFSFKTTPFMRPEVAKKALERKARDGVSLGFQPVRLYLEEDRDWGLFCSHIIPFTIIKK
jgi:hypothetical protein